MIKEMTGDGAKKKIFSGAVGGPDFHIGVKVCQS